METWNICPLMVRYRQTKRNFMNEMRLEKWRNEQRTELWGAIMNAFHDIYEPKREYWMRRLYRYYSDRLYHVTGCSWLIFISELTDEGAYGQYTSDKARRYCCMVRDTAYWMTHHEESDELAFAEPMIFAA